MPAQTTWVPSRIWQTKAEETVLMWDQEDEPHHSLLVLTSSGGCRTFWRYFFNTSSGVLPVGTGQSVSQCNWDKWSSKKGHARQKESTCTIRYRFKGSKERTTIWEQTEDFEKESEDGREREMVWGGEEWYTAFISSSCFSDLSHHLSPQSHFNKNLCWLNRMSNCLLNSNRAWPCSGDARS